MHPLRVWLVVSLGIAAAIAWAFGAATIHAGAKNGPAVVLSVLVFLGFLVPWIGVAWWAWRRAEDLDILTERSRQAVEGPEDLPITDRIYHGELDDLARAIEELRVHGMRQHRTFSEHRAAMDEIVASLGEGLLAVDGAGKVVFANERVAEMFDVTGALTRRSFIEVVRRQSLVGAFQRAFAGEASTDRITLGTGKSERKIEMRVFPVAASSEIAAVALFIDMTTIERLQRIRKDFLDDFSHEVRTPLAGLRSAAETIDAGDLTSEQELQLRHVIRRQLARIERLVGDLSELNRIESGELVLERQPIALREVLVDLCADFKERAPLRCTVRGGDDVKASADSSRVQQIFTNLLDNAWKHGGAKGEVLVEIGRESGDAVVKVSDEGEGIPPHEIERIFNRFYRVDKSRSQNIPGLGLGLAITKHLVLAHGGSIRAYNRSEGGATFEVRLPAA
jgi:two-component system phosphate regulon sensor histidine kinase PhoR